MMVPGVRAYVGGVYLSFFGAGTIIKIFLSFTSIPRAISSRPQPPTVSCNTMGFNCTPAMGVEQRGMRFGGTVIEKSTVKNCFYSPFIYFFCFFAHRIGASGATVIIFFKGFAEIKAAIPLMRCCFFLRSVSFCFVLMIDLNSGYR